MQEPFKQIVQSKELKEISVDLVEKILDSNITNEVIKEIPVLKSLISIRTVYNSFTDKLFIKKSMNVLLELKEVNWKERTEFIQELEDENQNGAEKLLMAIDRLETIEKCKVFGRLCKLKATNKIENTEDFLRLTKLIQDSYINDLYLITYFEKGVQERIDERDYFPLISLGLICQKQSEQLPIERNHQYSEHDPEFKGGEIEFKYMLTSLGELLYDYYYEIIE